MKWRRYGSQNSRCLERKKLRITWINATGKTESGVRKSWRYRAGWLYSGSQGRRSVTSKGGRHRQLDPRVSASSIGKSQICASATQKRIRGRGVRLWLPFFLPKESGADRLDWWFRLKQNWVFSGRRELKEARWTSSSWPGSRRLFPEQIAGLKVNSGSCVSIPSTFAKFWVTEFNVLRVQSVGVRLSHRFLSGNSLSFYPITATTVCFYLPGDRNNPGWMKMAWFKFHFSRGK